MLPPLIDLIMKRLVTPRSARFMKKETSNMATVILLYTTSPKYIITIAEMERERFTIFSRVDNNGVVSGK